MRLRARLGTEGISSPRTIARIILPALSYSLLGTASSFAISSSAAFIPHVGALDTLNNLAPIVFVLFFALVSLVFILIGKSRVSLRVHKSYFYLSALVSIMGLLGIWIDHSSALSTAGFILFCLGCALIQFYWLEQLASLAPSEVALALTASSAISSLAMLCVGFLEYASAPFSAAALMLCLLCIKYFDEAIATRTNNACKTKPSIDRKTLVKTLVGIGFIGFAIGIMQSVAVAPETGEPIYSFLPPLLSCAIVFALIVLPGDTSLLTAEQVVSSLVVVSLVLCIAGSFPQQAYLTSSVAMEVMTSVSLYAAVLVVKSGAYPALRVFGTIEGALSSSAIAIIIFAALDFDITQGPSILALTALFALAAIWLISDRGIDLLVNPKGPAAEDRSIGADSFAMKMQSLAETTGLSPRETDVFFLAATGRSAPFIAEKLVISENTVKSYMQKIYAKCGVHSRQELISLIDSIPG